MMVWLLKMVQIIEVLLVPFSIAVNKVCQFMHHPYEQTEARQKVRFDTTLFSSNEDY